MGCLTTAAGTVTIGSAINVAETTCGLSYNFCQQRERKKKNHDRASIQYG